jgi:hypothetical protein
LLDLSPQSVEDVVIEFTALLKLLESIRIEPCNRLILLRVIKPLESTRIERLSGWLRRQRCIKV